MSKIVGKKVPPKQVVDASDSESSESEQVPQKPVPTKKDKLQAKNQDKQAVVAGAKPSVKKAPVAKSESEEDDTPPVVAKKAVAPPAKKPAQKAKVSSSGSESDSEPAPVKKGEPTKPIKKGSAELKKVPQKPKAPEPDSDSEESEKPAKKATPVLQAKGKKPVEAPKVADKKAPVKPAQKSDSESESEEAPKPVKGKAVPAKPAVVAKKPAPPADDSDEDSSEPPIVAKGKGTKALSPKVAPKASPKVAPKNSPKLGAVAKKPVAKPVAKDESEDDEESEEVKPAPKSKPVVQAKQPAKGKKVPEPEPEEDDEEEEEEAKPVAKVAPKRKASAQKEDEKGEFEVYVGGLAWAMAEADIEALFAPCGEVLAVRLLRKEDGKSKGIAFVKFSTESARTKALELNESEQYGRPIKVEKSNGKAENPNKGFNNGGQAANKGSFTNDKPIPDVIESCTIFVGNMSYNSSPDSIKEFFADCGEIKDARIASDKETGRVISISNSAPWFRIR